MTLCGATHSSVTWEDCWSYRRKSHEPYHSLGSTLPLSRYRIAMAFWRLLNAAYFITLVRCTMLSLWSATDFGTSCQSSSRHMKIRLEKHLIKGKSHKPKCTSFSLFYRCDRNLRTIYECLHLILFFEILLLKYLKSWCQSVTKFYFLRVAFYPDCLEHKKPVKIRYRCAWQINLE